MDRVQCVKSEHLLSQFLPVTKGVPQDSILGPTLLSSYINDIVCLARHSSICLYADDRLLYTVGLSPNAVQVSLHDSFHRAHQTFSSLNLLLNTTKTKVMSFGRKGLMPLPPLNITTLDGTVLDQGPEYTYLGIWLDRNISFRFSHHISKLQFRIKSKLGFLY